MSTRFMHLVVVFACLAPFDASGQPRTTRVADSVSVAFIVRTAVIDLATDGRLAAFPGERSPWEISVPEQPAMWSSARSRLLEILGARAPVAADSSWGVLHFYPFAVRGDTLWASFEVGWRWRQCGVWTGSTTTMEVMSTRRQLFWEPATPRATFSSDPVLLCRPER